MRKYSSSDRNHLLQRKVGKYPFPFQFTLHVIESKWKLQIVYILLQGNRCRYGELKKSISPLITHKMLVQSLRELEQDGILVRHVYPQVPPRVEYALTENGKQLHTVIESMNTFGLHTIMSK